MQFIDITSEETLRALANDTYYWPSEDWQCEERAEKLLKWMFPALRRQLDLSSKIDFDHFGSGYASFVNAFFYRKTPEFMVIPTDYDQEYVGLWALFHRRSPHYVLGHGWIYAGQDCAGQYLPVLDDVDRFRSDAVSRVADDVQRFLTKQGFVRLTIEDVSLPIPKTIDVDTNLGDRPYHIFDAFFHWMD